MPKCNPSYSVDGVIFMAKCHCGWFAGGRNRYIVKDKGSRHVRGLV